MLVAPLCIHCSFVVPFDYELCVLLVSDKMPFVFSPMHMELFPTQWEELLSQVVELLLSERWLLSLQMLTT